jgi:hypothetical protein
MGPNNVARAGGSRHRPESQQHELVIGFHALFVAVSLHLISLRRCIIEGQAEAAAIDVLALLEDSANTVVFGTQTLSARVTRATRASASLAALQKQSQGHSKWKSTRGKWQTL